MECPGPEEGSIGQKFVLGSITTRKRKERKGKKDLEISSLPDIWAWMGLEATIYLTEEKG